MGIGNIHELMADSDDNAQVSKKQRRNTGNNMSEINTVSDNEGASNGGG